MDEVDGEVYNNSTCPWNRQLVIEVPLQQMQTINTENIHDITDCLIVCKLKYLGVCLLSGKKLRLSLREPKAKFFKALNGVLYRDKGFSNDK